MRDGRRAAGRDGGAPAGGPRTGTCAALARRRRHPARPGWTRCSAWSGWPTSPRRKVRGFSLGMSQRLGLAVALLGDPPTLLLDEPVNGLDPEGVALGPSTRAVTLAAEGRTVLISSHLMSEMALTADRVIVMGRGRVITDGPIADVIAQATRSSVLVHSPRSTDLAGIVTANGGRVDSTASDGALVLTGISAEAIGDLAAAHAIPLHQLVSQQGSLEDAFLSLTEGEQQFAAGEPADKESR